jgi:hypothetical protein
MTKVIALILLLLNATAPSPEIVARPVPFSHNQIKSYYQAPLWEWGAGHRGIDIAVSASSPIFSPFDGSVFFSGEVVDRQVLTLISVSGLKASFEPVCGLQGLGSRVNKNQPVGIYCPPEKEHEMHCENCIHFSIRNEHGYLNPLLYFGELKPTILKR